MSYIVLLTCIAVMYTIIGICIFGFIALLLVIILLIRYRLVYYFRIDFT